jgi:hypothetical protein
MSGKCSSSRCERPGRLRAARNMPPVISTIVLSRFFARRQRTSMSAYFTNSLTPPTSIGLLASPFAAGTFPVGQRAARSLPEKMACPFACGGGMALTGSRPSTRAPGRGSPVAAPYNREQRWTPKQETTFSCLPPCRCPAQASPGPGITLFSPRSLSRSLPLPSSTPRARRTGADMDPEERKGHDCGRRPR